jgi:hypothetical protein
VDSLSEQLQKSRAVQIVSGSGTVYAEGQFQNENPRNWLVRLTKQLVSCPLSDLTNAQICIGGVCKADFGANCIVYGTAHEGAKCTGTIRFSIGGTGWIFVSVGPFPSHEAFSFQIPDDAGLEDMGMASFLSQELAVHHPELPVTFGPVNFDVIGVRGAIQNLNLDPAILEALDPDAEETIEGEVQRGMRIRAAAAAEAENGVEDDTDVEGGVEG